MTKRMLPHTDYVSRLALTLVAAICAAALCGALASWARANSASAAGTFWQQLLCGQEGARA